MAAKLTDKQRLFITEYLVDLNATQATIRAGYSIKTAQRIGSELLSKPLIQAEIQKRQAEMQNKLEVTQERIIQELVAMAFSNTTDFVRIIKSGAAQTVEITPTDKLLAEKLPAIAGIKQGANGIEVKLQDKIKALELLGKYLGYLDIGPGAKSTSLADTILAAYALRKEGDE